jgi:hypothetical protein
MAAPASIARSLYVSIEARRRRGIVGLISVKVESILPTYPASDSLSSTRRAEPLFSGHKLVQGVR